MPLRIYLGIFLLKMFFFFETVSGGKKSYQDVFAMIFFFSLAIKIVFCQLSIQGESWFAYLFKCFMVINGFCKKTYINDIEFLCTYAFSSSYLCDFNQCMVHFS